MHELVYFYLFRQRKMNFLTNYPHFYLFFFSKKYIAWRANILNYKGNKSIVQCVSAISFMFKRSLLWIKKLIIFQSFYSSRFIYSYMKVHFWLAATLVNCKGHGFTSIVMVTLLFLFLHCSQVFAIIEELVFICNGIWFDFLIAVAELQLEEGEDFLDNLNPCTRRETSALGDSNMRNLKRGEILQLERKGYYRCDVPFLRPSKPIVLFAIPDGRQQTWLNWLPSILQSNDWSSSTPFKRLIAVLELNMPLVLRDENYIFF